MKWSRKKKRKINIPFAKYALEIITDSAPQRGIHVEIEYANVDAMHSGNKNCNKLIGGRGKIIEIINKHL